MAATRYERRSGTAAAEHPGVNCASGPTGRWTLEDGLGVRHLETDPKDGGTIEVLELEPSLAAIEPFEAAMRARAARLVENPIDGIAALRRIERNGTSLRVVANHVPGLRLPELLHETIKSNVPLPLSAALELSAAIVRTTAILHQLPGGLSHGAITPAHIVVTRDAQVVLTDAVFGPALELLQRNREQLWREFRVAMPPSATLPRFDQRGDVAQLAVTSLAVALGRVMRADEYPKPIADIVVAATLAARPGESGTPASGFRMWLQQALYLHPRSSFASAVDAERTFEEFLGSPAARRGGEIALRSIVRRVFGDTPDTAEATKIAAAWSTPTLVHPVPADKRPDEPLISPSDPAPSSDPSSVSLQSLFRSVFPNLRTN
jgi:hypothetical protein